MAKPELIAPKAQNTPLFQMVAKHLNHEAIAPSVRGGIEIPPELEQIVLSCLAKKPDARQSSAAPLAQSLAGVPVEPWTEARAREWWENRLTDGAIER